MILAPILLLILYHDFTTLMLYRKNLEEKTKQRNISTWRIGPEAIGHYLSDNIPHKLRYIKFLWSAIILLTLFLPAIPACYFSLYGGSDYQNIGGLVVTIDIVCCILIFTNFLMLVNEENLLGIRDISITFTADENTSPQKKYNRTKLLIAIPIILALLTFLPMWGLTPLDYKQASVCALTAFIQATLLSTFSLLRSRAKKNKYKKVFSILLGAIFLPCFYWLMIDILACFGGIHFKEYSFWDYTIWSIALFFPGLYFKAIYLAYLGRNQVNDVPDK